jgi:hypothetical protein
MNPLRVYIDTSVFGGYYDVEFAEITRPFFDMIFAEKITPLLSDTLIAELTDAPPQVRALLQEVLPFGELLPVTQTAVYLQEAYIRNAVVSAKYIDDALHVAQATVAHAQVLTIMSPFDVTKALEVSDETE